MKRVNLCLGDGDFAILRRVAEFDRIPVGSWARQAVAQAAAEKCKRLRDAGMLAEYEQLHLFTAQRKGHK